jgi:hypothetical protein
MTQMGCKKGSFDAQHLRHPRNPWLNLLQFDAMFGSDDISVGASSFRAVTGSALVNE